MPQEEVRAAGLLVSLSNPSQTQHPTTEATLARKHRAVANTVTQNSRSPGARGLKANHRFDGGTPCTR